MVLELTVKLLFFFIEHSTWIRFVILTWYTLMGLYYSRNFSILFFVHKFVYDTLFLTKFPLRC